MLFTGWPVDIEEHSGWTGFVHSSWSLKNSTQSQKPSDKINSINDLRFNGESKVLYWADVSSEMAFVVPTEWNARTELDGGCTSLCSNNSSGDSLQSNSSSNNVWQRQTDANAENVKATIQQQQQKSRNLSLELDKSKDPVPPTRRKTNAMKPTLLAQAPAKIMLVWLESYEDHFNFPIGK